MTRARLLIVAVLILALFASCVADPCDGAPGCDPLELPC